MNSDQLEGKWKQFKGAAKEKWGKLTDDDIDVIHGQRDKLVGKLQERYGVAKEEAHKQADAWFTEMKFDEAMQQPPPPAADQGRAAHSGKR